MGADTKKMRNLRPICPGGEIGRRDSFRFYWIHVLVGSSPVPGTLYYFPSLRGCLFLIRKHRHAFDFFFAQNRQLLLPKPQHRLREADFSRRKLMCSKTIYCHIYKKTCPTHNTHQHEKNEGRTTSNSCHAPLSLLKINQKAFKLMRVSMPSN